LAGVRYTHEERTAAGSLVPSNNVGTVLLNEDHTWTATTWRAGAQWDVTPASMLYATVATGFHSGGFFFSADNPVYQPEHIHAYTLGSKNRFLNGRLQANLEAFYWDYKDEQFSHLSLDSHFDIVFKTENIGHVPIKGAEIQTQYLLTDHTLLGAQAQYLDSYYRQFTYDQPLIPPLSGCPVSSAFGPGGPVYTVNCQGQQPPQSPRWTVNLALQHTLPLPEGKALVASINTHYQTKTPTGLDNLSPELQGSYWMTDAVLTWRSEGNRWNVSAFVNNIENAAVKGTTFFEPFGGIAPGSPPIAAASLRPPRVYGVRVAAHF
jgi:iron complex outermembrane receptor protein